MTGPVDHYLDQLFDSLSGTGATGRRALTEAEDHLRSTVEELVAAGVPDEEAQRTAVSRFGNPAQVAMGLRRAHDGIGAVLRPIFSGAWLLGAIGMIAIGVSGLIAEFLGPHFVAGDSSGVTYTPERCAEYIEYFPDKTCAVAAEMHHWGEVVQYRVAAGMLGLLALGAYALARRFGPIKGTAWAPPSGPFALVTIAVFGLSGALLTLPSLMEIVFGQTSGVGANLTGGVVALLLAFGTTVLALRRQAANRTSSSLMGRS